MAATLPSIGFRGPAAAVELGWACAVGMLSMAAAWAVWTKVPAAVAFARAAVLAIALRDLQALYWTRLPSGVIPGTRTMLAAGILAVNAAAWLAVARLGARD